MSIVTNSKMRGTNKEETVMAVGRWTQRGWSVVRQMERTLFEVKGALGISYDEGE